MYLGKIDLDFAYTFPKLYMSTQKVDSKLKNSLIAPSNLLPSSQRWTPLLPWRHQSFGDFHIWKRAQFWCCYPCNQNFCLPAYWRLNMSTLESDVQKAWFFDRPQQYCEKGRWMKPFYLSKPVWKMSCMSFCDGPNRGYSY